MFVFLVLYGYVTLIYNADPSAATSFYEYVDPSEGKPSDASFVSIPSTLTVKGFHLLVECNGVDAFASVDVAQSTTSPSPTESLEDASKTEKEGDVQPTASEMPLPKREVINTPKPTPSIPTVGVHTTTQAPNTTGRVVSKEPAKVEQALKKEVKKELLFIPPRLINRTRFEREVWRLPPEFEAHWQYGRDLQSHASVGRQVHRSGRRHFHGAHHELVLQLEIASPRELQGLPQFRHLPGSRRRFVGLRLARLPCLPSPALYRNRAYF